MSKEKYEVEVIKEEKNVKNDEKLIVYKSSILSSGSGIIILLLFIIICYLSVIKSQYFPWLLFGIVSLPIIRREYNNVSIIVLGLSLIICATSGILINGLNEMMFSEYLITKPMAMGIAILGLIYITIVTFYKKIKFIDNINTLLFFFLILVTSYPIFIICVFVGSLLGYLGVTMLQIIMYVLLLLPIVLAFYLIFGRKNKVIKSK